jgi:hypothetical protein
MNLAKSNIAAAVVTGASVDLSAELLLPRADGDGQVADERAPAPATTSLAARIRRHQQV